MLHGADARVTGDLELVRELWPHARAAVDWMERYGDRDGGGYLEYARRTAHGLANQGWKDSGDSIFHADGRLAEPPIAPVEVQGYRYAALLAMAELSEAIEVDGAADWLAAAASLRPRIHDPFWREPEGEHALAHDPDNRPRGGAAADAGPPP